ncbi:hypothetical protein DL237_14925 [Pseudooceanicola sediminis]|uniref:Uncharacterized protein n=1 Tax=Pseudooceanicola sediminis TaxID=2211117 RepID=A0A399J237_9RHOB|nr:hypothetical protein [Pseudooceanicola sediminis]RII37962.1 hypothetical protein DL237_14925 [Pseudooceanicola sediminis]|tara:strand:- start:5678 stop:6010 length:333 start_codon:yes stop_codon:yes gene_type:complete
MKTLLNSAAFALCLLPSVPALASTPATPETAPRPVIVSCFRGPWTEVIWDHANPKFIRSLRALGYDQETSEAIGNDICRNPALVNDPAAMRAEMTRIYEESLTYLSRQNG